MKILKIVTATNQTIQITEEGVAFTAVTSFKLPTPPGGIAPDVHRGDDMVFDSDSNLHFQGTVIPCPRFPGAIKAGWVVPADDFSEDVQHVAKSANISIRPAEGGNPLNPKPKHAVSMAQPEEREVRRVYQGKTANNTAGVATAADGVVVRTLTTPAKSTTEMTDSNFAVAEARANSVKVKPGRGITRDEMLDQMDDESREQYLAELEARKSSKDGVVASQAKAVSAPKKAVPAPKKATASAAVLVPATGVDVRRKVAKSICPDFPDNYDFNLPVKKKIARLMADYEDRPDVIKAVAAAETDADMRHALIEEFAEVFG